MGMMRQAKRWALCAAGACAALFGASCTMFEESGLPGSASSMAHNQIMYVAAEPETFGHYRLLSLMRLHADMDLFVSQRGMPEFLAETSSGRKHYYILYYPKQRQAFVARNRPTHHHRLEFAGPYPVTAKEIRILDNLRNGPNPKAIGGAVRVR
jgi:hypothetical protein